MNVYIATKFENAAQFNELFDLLKCHGHLVTHDWTKESAGGKTGFVRTNYLARCADADFDGVIVSDVLIFIYYPDKPMVGAYVEMGMALALGKQVIVVGADKGSTNIFNYLPEVVHVETLEDAVRFINTQDSKVHVAL